MKDYIRREIKFLLYIVFIFFIVLVLVPLLGGKKPEYNFDGILQDRRMLTFVILIFAYSLVYPVVTFTTVKRYLNGSFSENREHFEKVFETLGYEKTEEHTDRIVYRKRSRTTRFLQWGEDKVVINTRVSPLTMSGMRKNVKRIDSMIDQLMRQKEETPG